VRNFLFLLLLTIFSLLFLITFHMYRSKVLEIENLKEKVKAYEIYIFRDFDEFTRYIEKNGVEIPYLENLKRRKAKEIVSDGIYQMRMANYSTAIAKFKKALELLGDDPLRKTVEYYLSICERKVLEEEKEK